MTPVLLLVLPDRSAPTASTPRFKLSTTINGRDEFAFLDTGASPSVVSSSMYYYLDGQTFPKEQVPQITLADGIPRVQNAKSGQDNNRCKPFRIPFSKIASPDI